MTFVLVLKMTCRISPGREREQSLQPEGTEREKPGGSHTTEFQNLLISRYDWCVGVCGDVWVKDKAESLMARLRS